MSQIEIVCGLPCVNTERKQTHFSIGSRITAIFLGSIGIIGGLLIVLNIPVINILGPTTGWISLSIGIPLALVAFAIKCVKKQLNKNDFDQQISDSPLALSIKNYDPTLNLNSKILAINDTSSHADPLLCTPWHQRPLPKGFTQCRPMNFDGYTKMLKSVIVCGGGHHPEIRQINIYPLNYKLHKQHKRILVDFSNQNDVLKSSVSSLELDSGLFYSNSKHSSSIIESLKEDFSFMIQRGGGVFDFEDMPDVIFFTAHNGLQCEIGYLNIREIVGHEVDFNVQANSTISYSTKPGIVPPKKTNRTGQICITTQTGGYIGHPTKCQLFPSYLKDITLEDNSPLPLDDEDFFCKLFVSNMSHQLQNLGLPYEIDLPGALFKNKKDGDSIRLRFKGKLIELTIEQQNHGLKFAKGSFEDIFRLQSEYIKQSCDVVNPLFGIYNPLWFYKIDNGFLFKLEDRESEKNVKMLHLIDNSSENFISKINPSPAEGHVQLSKDKQQLIFNMVFPGFLPQDFDIILNETHIIVYGRFENRLITSELESLKKATIIKMDWEIDKPLMFASRWDKMECFNGRTLDDMKAIMQKSTLFFYDGILTLNIPLE